MIKVNVLTFNEVTRPIIQAITKHIFTNYRNVFIDPYTMKIGAPAGSAIILNEPEAELLKELLESPGYPFEVFIFVESTTRAKDILDVVEKYNESITNN